MTREFCTYLDHRYLSRLLVLHASMLEHVGQFRLWVLCMDDRAASTLRELELPGVVPIELAEFERGDEGLARAKADRSTVEYYFTCTPSLPLYVLSLDESVDEITYVDADIRLFASPDPLFEAMGDDSVSVIEHRFPDDMRHLEIAGRFNVAWLTFRRNEQGLAVLRDWRQRCLEWCYDRFEDGKFADQKYLDAWPQGFPGVKILDHPGANLAPWNLRRHEVGEVSGQLSVDGRPLIFYHYHGLKPISRRLWDLNLTDYRAEASDLILRRIYGRYFRELHAARKSLKGVPSPTGYLRGHTPWQLGGPLRRWLRLLRGVIRRDYVFVVNGKML